MTPVTSTPEQIARGVQILREGGVVAFPTETVYGLGADALNEAAVAHVFALKGRPHHNPLIVHISGPEMALTLARSWGEREQRLAETFWPGPLTIIAPASDLVPRIVRANGPTIALRCPDHPITLALIEAFGGPLVGPSANRSGEVSPTTPDHVLASFPDLFVLDGGPARAGIESTVVRLLPDRALVLRQGLITPEQLRSVLALPVEIAPAPSPGEDLGSPGRLPRHYAPSTPARLLSRVEILAIAGRRVVVLAASPLDAAPGRVVLAMPSNARAYASRLYAALREADALGMELIAIERPDPSGPEAEVWHAVLDRLERACA